MVRIRKTNKELIIDITNELLNTKQNITTIRIQKEIELIDPNNQIGRTNVSNVLRRLNIKYTKESGKNNTNNKRSKNLILIQSIVNELLKTNTSITTEVVNIELNKLNIKLGNNSIEKYLKELNIDYIKSININKPKAKPLIIEAKQDIKKNERTKKVKIIKEKKQRVVKEKKIFEHIDKKLLESKNIQNNDVKKRKELSAEEYTDCKGIIVKAIDYYRKKYSVKNIDEMFDEANYILVVCLKNFDESKGAKFTTYLYNCLIYGFHNYFSKKNKEQMKSYLRNGKEYECLNLGDVFSAYNPEKESLEDEFIRVEDSKTIAKAIKEIMENNLPKFYVKSIEQNTKNGKSKRVDKRITNMIQKILLEKYKIDITDYKF